MAAAPLLAGARAGTDVLEVPAGALPEVVMVLALGLEALELAKRL